MSCASTLSLQALKESVKTLDKIKPDVQNKEITPRYLETVSLNQTVFFDSEDEEQLAMEVAGEKWYMRESGQYGTVHTGLSLEPIEEVNPKKPGELA